jgi:hypothetical protein
MLSARGGLDPQKVEAIKRQFVAAARDGMQDGLEVVLSTSNQLAPIEEGTLIRSGTVSMDTSPRIRGAVSYDTPYAVRQHEEMGYRHDAGRQAKFLETAFNRDRLLVAEAITRKIRGM